MGWIQNLCDTYDICAAAAGISGADQSKMLLPIYHTLTELNLIIYLNGDGTFNRAEKVNKTYICIPCTDESEGRSGTDAINNPHPLFDQVKYLEGQKYVDNLKEWVDYLLLTNKYPVAYKALSAVYNYINGKTLSKDLNSCGIKYKDDDFLAFCVYINNFNEDRLWEIKELHDAWIEFYSNSYFVSLNKNFCYVTGQEAPYPQKYPKNINRNSGNAKLISSNDKNNFTFRGRFKNPEEAVTVSYEASQKAHQMLRWLISKKECYKCAEQAIFAWAVDKQTDVVDFYKDSYDIYDDFEVKTNAQKILEANTAIYVDYSEKLKDALLGYLRDKKLEEHTRKIVLMSTDAATDGRMSITYYREFFQDEYEEKILAWHSSCKWYQPFEKDKDGNCRKGYFIGSPSFGRIATAVLGKRRDKKDDSYDKLLKNLRKQLLHCIFDGEKIPVSMVSSAFNRAKNPFSFENFEDKDKDTKNERWKEWENALCTTCALIKRYYSDYKKEEFSVELEKERNDRDYLYGRLLAIADRIESHAMHIKNKKEDGDERATNAMRYMAAFSQHPFRTWNMLFAQQLNPYIVELNGAGWYMNLIGEVTSLFKSGEYESDASLDGRFLLGFFAQRQEIFKEMKENKNLGGKENESFEEN